MAKGLARDWKELPPKSGEEGGEESDRGEETSFVRPGKVLEGIGLSILGCAGFRMRLNSLGLTAGWLRNSNSSEEDSERVELVGGPDPGWLQRWSLYRSRRSILYDCARREVQSAQVTWKTASCAGL